MKPKAMAWIVALCLVAAIFVAPQQAAAAAAWYDCDINAVGNGSDGGNTVQLTGVAQGNPADTFTLKFFNLPAGSVANVFLATLLTAVSTNKQVSVFVDKALPGNPVISNITIANK